MFAQVILKLSGIYSTTASSSSSPLGKLHRIPLLTTLNDPMVSGSLLFVQPCLHTNICVCLYMHTFVHRVANVMVTLLKPSRPNHSNSEVHCIPQSKYILTRKEYGVHGWVGGCSCLWVFLYGNDRRRPCVTASLFSVKLSVEARRTDKLAPYDCPTGSEPFCHLVGRGEKDRQVGSI